jgi:autotransporter translocation and assembly factor TamB
LKIKENKQKKERSVSIRIFSWLGKGSLILLITIILLCGSVLFLYWQTNLVAGAAEKYINSKLAGKGKIEYGIISGSLLNNINIDYLNFQLDDNLLLSSKNIKLSYDIWSVWNDQLKISSVYVDSVNIKLLSKTREDNKVKTAQVKSAFNLDSLLYRIQNAHIIDTLLAKIPPLQLDEFEIVAGNLQVQDKELSFKNINLTAAANFNPDNFKLELIHFSAYWQEKDFQLNNLSFQILGNRNQITLNQFVMETGGGDTYFNLAGDLELADMNLILSVEDFKLDLNSFKGFLPEIEDSGFLNGNFHLIGTPQNFTVNTDIKGKWQKYILNQFKLDASYNYGKILVDAFHLKSNPGNISLKAAINPTSSAQGQLDFSAINFNVIDTSYAISDINGFISINFPSGTFDVNNLKKTISGITGEGVLNINNSSYGDAHLDSLQFAFLADNGNFNIRQPSFVKLANHARFDLYGDLNRNKEMDLQVHTSFGDLNELTTAIGLDSIYGDYYTDFIATGKLDNPLIEGFFRVNNFIYKDVYLDSMDFDISLTNLFTIPVGTANFTIKKGSVYDIPIRDVTLRANKNEKAIFIPTAKIFSEDNYIETSLKISDSAAVTFVDIDYLRMEYENYWLQNKENIYIAIDSVSTDLKNFNLQGPRNALLEAKAEYNFMQNDADIDINLVNLNIEPFQQFLGEDHKTGGVLNGRAVIRNLNTEPNVLVDLVGDDIIYNNVKMGNFKTDLHYDNEKIIVREFFLESDTAKITMEGEINLQFDKGVFQLINLIKNTRTNLKITWQNINLNNYNGIVKLKHPLRGKLNGSLEFVGTLGEPFMKHNMTLDDFKYHLYEIDSLTMFSQYSGGYLILDSLSAQFNGTSFSMKGYQQIGLNIDDTDSTFNDNPFDFLISSKDNNLDFAGILSEQIESIYGDYDFEMNISGTPQAPTVNYGRIIMKDGTVLLSRVKDPIENVDIDLTVEDGLLTINRFEGKSQKEQDFWQIGWGYLRRLWSWMLPREKEKGIFALQGTVNLENALKPDLNLKAVLNEFYADYFVENTKIMLNSDQIEISGKDTLSITGDIIIPYGEFEVNLDQIQKNIYLAEPDAGKATSNLALAVNVEIPGNFVVTSSALDFQNNFKIVLSGNLQANMNPGSNNLALIGILETESGHFASFNQSFEIESGNINFSDPLKINPELDITATKRVQDNLFQLIITGNLESIHQDIIIRDNSGTELNLSPQDKIALLTLGADLTMLSSKSDSTLRSVGEDVASNVVLTAAERGVEELTGLDRVEISSSDKFLDLQKLKLNNGLKQASISFGKYLTSDLYVEYRTQFGSGVPTPKLAWDSGNKISLQYRINKNWSVDSHYEKTLLFGNNKVQVGVSWELAF